MSEENKLKILNGYRAFKRAGPFIRDIFKNPSKKLTGEEALRIYNQYGISPSNIVLLALSHDFEIDKEKFICLLDEQEEEMKNRVLCAGTAISKT
jgi:alanyl-tRNA synthetase